jgi:hypothetical protein
VFCLREEAKILSSFDKTHTRVSSRGHSKRVSVKLRVGLCWKMIATRLARHVRARSSAFTDVRKRPCVDPTRNSLASVRTETPVNPGPDGVGCPLPQEISIPISVQSSRAENHNAFRAQRALPVFLPPVDPSAIIPGHRPLPSVADSPSRSRILPWFMQVRPPQIDTTSSAAQGSPLLQKWSVARRSFVHEWFLAHAARPAWMHSNEAVDELCQSTGLSEPQLRRWLTRAQARFRTLLMVATRNPPLHSWLQQWANELELGVDLVTVASRIGLSRDLLTRYLVETRTIRSLVQLGVLQSPPSCESYPWDGLSAHARWWASLPVGLHQAGEPSTPLVEAARPPSN